MRVAFAIEVALAHGLRRKAEGSGDAVQNILDHQHALRPAEAAERRLRSLMRLADEARDLERRDVVRVIDVKHGASEHGFGEVKAPAAIGVEADTGALQAALVVEPGFELRAGRDAACR